MDRRQTLLAAAIVQFGSFVLILGIPDGILGVLWPTMRRSLDRPLADLGLIVLAGTALYLLGGVTGNWVHTRLGLRWTLVLSTTLGCLSLLGWALSPGWWWILASLALLGYVKGVLDAVLNAVEAIDGGVRQLGLLHACWAIGGTLGPVVVAALVTGRDWRLAVLVVGIASATLIPFALVRPDRVSAGADEGRVQIPRPRVADSVHTAASSGATDGATDVATAVTAPTEVERLPRRRTAHGRSVTLGLVATTLAFVAYMAAEAGPISWGATYLESDRHLSAAVAAGAMAGYWAALTVGRLALALPQRWRPEAVLEVSAVLCLVGAALVWLLPGGLAVAGLPVAGLGAAAIFPLYMALTPDRLGEEVTGRAVGYAIAGTAIGGPLAVGLFGILAGHYGTWVLGPCIFAGSVVMYAGHRVLHATVRPRQMAAVESSSR